MKEKEKTVIYSFLCTSRCESDIVLVNPAIQCSSLCLYLLHENKTYLQATVLLKVSVTTMSVVVAGKHYS